MSTIDELKKIYGATENLLFDIDDIESTAICDLDGVLTKLHRDAVKILGQIDDLVSDLEIENG